MTREEAIKHLETYSTTNGSGQTTQAQHEEAKQMAIKALEQEPCVDCISRQAVLEAIFKRPAWHNSDGSYYHSDEIRKAVNELPSANPAEKTGRLVDIDDGHSVECSECGKWFYHGYLAKIEIKYCPNCGAKMIEPQERSGKG